MLWKGKLLLYNQNKPDTSRNSLEKGHQAATRQSTDHEVTDFTGDTDLGLAERVVHPRAGMHRWQWGLWTTVTVCLPPQGPVPMFTRHQRLSASLAQTHRKHQNSEHGLAKYFSSKTRLQDTNHNSPITSFNFYCIWVIHTTHQGVSYSWRNT